MHAAIRFFISGLILSSTLAGCGGGGGGGGGGGSGGTGGGGGLNTYVVTTSAYVSADQNLAITAPIPTFRALHYPAGGVIPYTYSYTGTLPQGLTFDPATSIITGTPTAVYPTASVTFSVSDSYGNVSSTTSTVNFTVLAASYDLTTATGNSGTPVGGKLLFPVTISAIQSSDNKTHTYYYYDGSGDGTSSGVDTVTHDKLDQIFNGGTLGDTAKDTTDTPSTNTFTLSNGVRLHMLTNAEAYAFTGTIYTAWPGAWSPGPFYWTTSQSSPGTHYEIIQTRGYTPGQADNTQFNVMFEVL